jgi:heptosyltransferase-2
MTPPIEKALIIRFSSIGDILLSSLLVRVFRKRFPACRLDFLVKEEYADLVQHNPNLSSVIRFPANGKFDDLVKLKKQIRETRYDLTIDIHDSLRSRYLCFGMPNVVRINKRKLARFLLVKTKWNFYHLFGGAPNVAERYLEPVEHLGVENDGGGLEIYLPEKATEKGKQLVSDRERNGASQFIGLAPSASHANKIWSGEGFAEVAASLASRNKAVIVLFGSAKDIPRCNEIERIITEKVPAIRVLNLAGKTSLVEAAAVMDYCSLIVTNDSGLMHLGAARKKKILAIFGPTVREFGFFPYGTRSVVLENNILSCRPCTHIGLPECPKKHFRCMKDINPAQVIEAAQELFPN